MADQILTVDDMSIRCSFNDKDKSVSCVVVKACKNDFRQCSEKHFPYTYHTTPKNLPYEVTIFGGIVLAIMSIVIMTIHFFKDKF